MFRTQFKFYDAGIGLVELTGGDGSDVIPSTIQTIEGLNEDGTLVDGYEKMEDGTIKKKEPSNTADKGDTPPDPNAEPNPDATDDQSNGQNNVDAVKAFWDTVNKITGEEVEVDFGDVDPISPEGVALREKAIRDQTATQFEKYLQEKDPRGYAYLIHRENGGSDEDFFNANRNDLVLPTDEELEKSVDAQTKVIKSDLKDKSLPDDIIELTIKHYIQNNLLLEKSKESLGNIKAGQEAYLESIKQKANLAEQEFNNKSNLLVNTIKNVIEKEVGFVVPETKKQEVLNYIQERIRYDEGKFYIVNEVNDSSLKTLLESQVFNYFQGDLKKIVTRQAKTIATQALRLNIENSKSTQQGTDGTKNTGGKPLTLMDVFN